MADSAPEVRFRITEDFIGAQSDIAGCYTIADLVARLRQRPESRGWRFATPRREIRIYAKVGPFGLGGERRVFAANEHR